MIDAAQAGGAVLKKYFGESLETAQKTTASDFRTKADLESEDAILSMLEQDFPDYSIFSEERGHVDKHSAYTFIIDPLDGTNNFVLGLPNFSVSIGLLHGNDIVAGAITCPMIDNVYYAEKGSGSFCDGKKIQVNAESDITKATICHNCSYETHYSGEEAVTRGLNTKNAKRVMASWCPTFDFCMLASGRIEGIVNNNSELYDFAAGKLIAREAGALITDFHGNPEENDRNQRFIASNGTTIHSHLAEVVRCLLA